MNPERLQRLSEILLSLKSIVKCPICWDHIESTSELECSHRFCNTCLLELRSKSSICPLCNVTIGKRASTYKDQFADDLSKFINHMCQLIKEKYAYEVDELCSKESNLKEIIETAPQDAHSFLHPYISKDTPTIVSDNAFDRLIINSKKCYANKKKQVDQPDKTKVLSFNCNDTRIKIINWLSDNQKNLDILTQSPQFITDDEGDFQMPSVSQVQFTWKNKQINRSQSLTVNSSLQGPLMKRCQSFTEGLNGNDNYMIEEVQSEKFVKQVEIKVIQDLLEDECLANLDHVAQLDKENPKITPKRSKIIRAKNQTTNLNSSGSSSGWDRIKEVKKSIKSSLRKPNKLKIKVQDINVNVKKNPKGNTKKLPTENNTYKAGTSHKRGKALKSREQKKVTDHSIIKDDLKKKNNQSFNLTKFEEFEQQMKYIKGLPKANNSSEMKIDIIDTTAKSIMGLKQNNENVTKIDKIVREEIFCLPTQVTADMCHILPMRNEFDDVKMIATRLSDNLKSCLSSASNLQNEIGHQLVNCFTNLLTYAEKIVQIRSENVRNEMQTSRVSQKSRTIMSNTIATQTLELPIKIFLNKNIQTSQNISDAEAQTNKIVYMDQGIQTTESFSQLPQEALRDSSSTKTFKQRKSFTQSVDSKIVDELIPFETIHTSDSTKDQHMFVDDSEENKSSKKYNNISQDSILMCTLNTTSIPEKKPNRTFEGSKKRKFKRIRKTTSVSDSDDNGTPIKRKFVRDDLTVEFMDTENVMKNVHSQQKNCSSSESEKIDYDENMLGIIRKYDSSPPKLKVPSSKNKASQLKSSNSETLTDITVNKTGKSQSLKLASCLNKSQGKSQTYIDSGEHVFTASIVLQENLGKFDQEILEFERTSKSYNTEFDLVENTPIVSPQPKIHRLSNKKKDPMQPLQIISKGSACSKNSSKKCDSSLTEYNHTDLIKKDVSALDQHIENLPSQVDKCTVGVAGILEDLQIDEDFFKINLECDDEEKHSDFSPRQSSVIHDVTMVNFSNKDKPNVNCGQGGGINIIQENIDEILENLNGFNEDDDLEELRRINFTAEERRDNESNRIRVLKNIKLKSQDKPNKELDCVIDNSDLSDEEIVETTPQKRKCSSNDQSILKNLQELENSFDNDALDFYLSPPPGFGDEGGHSPLPEVLRETQISQKDNCLAVKKLKSSATPDRLSDFIVTPDEKPQNTQKEDSFITPNRPLKPRISTPRSSQIAVDESDGIFSPIAKCSLKQTQNKYTPLVSTSRLATRKPNLMTSTPHQKSILNYVVPSQESSVTRSQKSRPCIMWSRIINKDLNVFSQLEYKKILTTSKVFGSQVTHLVVLVDEKGQIVSHTAKILQAIAAGIWVVRYEWAQDCLKMNRIIPEAPYEALDITGVPGPQISRLLRATKPLFKGYKFYCAPPLKSVPKEDLESILKLSGGEIARDLSAMLINDGKIHIILTESSATEETDQFETWLDIYKAVSVDVEWLTSCIGQYDLMSFRPFLISGDESMICELGYPPKLVESVPLTLTEAT